MTGGGLGVDTDNTTDDPQCRFSHYGVCEHYGQCDYVDTNGAPVVTATDVVAEVEQALAEPWAKYSKLWWGRQACSLLDELSAARAALAERDATIAALKAGSDKKPAGIEITVTGQPPTYDEGYSAGLAAGFRRGRR